MKNAQKLQSILTPDQRVRLFISSTLQELKQERQTVRDSIRELKLYPIMFEGGSRSHPPQDLYRAYLEQSHIYIGIFWKSYGWVAPGMQISGIEDEYNLSEGKPRLVYVKDAPDGRDPKLEKLLQRIRDEGTVCYQTFSTKEELGEFIKDDVMLMLSERFGIATQPPHQTTPPVEYLRVIQSEIEQRGAIKREGVLSEIKDRLKREKALLLVGDPGIGKTFILGTLGKELDAIYISLRNRTAQQVYSHLANHLSLRRGQFPQNLPSEDEARAALQEELANGTVVLLIDDIDQNLPVAQSFSSLDFYNCHFILAARSDPEFLVQGLSKYPVPPFNREETEQYLHIHNITLPPGEFQSLYSASQGNPLYLYYFSQYQISPLPEGLEAYQRILWQQLPSMKQELMNLISFSLSPLEITDLHSLLNRELVVSKTIMETKQLLDSAAPLVKQTEGFYELFHPHFDEFIYSEAVKLGLSPHYHHILGEYALSKERIVPTAFHFLRANDPRMKDFLLSAAHTSMLRGEWLFAEEFLQKELEFATADGDKPAQAQARQLLSQVFQELGEYQHAREQADLSVQLCKEVGDKELTEMAEVWRSTLLIDEGRAADTIEILKQALELYRNKDELKEAFIQLNLSFAYIQVSLFREGAEAAQRALDLFTNLGDERGMQASLLNLSGCVGNLGNLELQRQYAEQIIEMADKRNLMRLKAGGLNQLAFVQRRKDEYSEAQKSLEESIAICQSLGMKDTEILNIANLGNVFRDQKLYDKAESAYTESLLKSREHGFLRHEARALELLAHIKYDKRLYEEAIKLGTEALKLHKQFGEHLRLASTQDYLARSYLKLEHKEEAAESYEDSAKHYEASGQLDDAAYGFNRAASIWNSLERWERAASCISEGLGCALQGKYPEYADSLLEEALQSKHPSKYGEFYLQTLQLYAGKAELSFAGLMLNFSAYCKQHPDEKVYFQSGLDTLIDALKLSPQETLLNALAVAIEQASSDILPVANFQSIVERITGIMNHLHHRLLSDGVGIWTLGLNWQKPIVIQIRFLDDDYIAQRIAMALALILLTNKGRIEANVSILGGNLEDGFSLEIMMERTFLEATKMRYQPLPQDHETPASFIASRIPWGEPQPSTYIALDDDYETVANWERHPGNKAFVWVLMNVHSFLVAHCIHKSHEDAPELARKSREFCQAVLK